MSVNETAGRLSELFSEIYFHCHPTFEVELSHQAVRAMQLIAVTGPVTIHSLSEHLNVAHNTASEIVRRLQAKKLVIKYRRHEDERVVEVRLTEEGREAVSQHTGLDIVRLMVALEKMPENERTDIENTLTKLLSAVRGASHASVNS